MTDELTASELELSVVLPAHNEVSLLGSTVTNLVSGLASRSISAEVIIVENGSSDGTLRLARLMAAQLPGVRVLSLSRGNYGEALQAGITASRGKLVATFDVDYYDLSFLEQAVTLVRDKGIGVVVASKRAPGASDRRPIGRRALTLVFTTLLVRLVGLEVSDAHGMKLFERASIQPSLARCRLANSMFDVELVLRAQRDGVLLAELPASVVERRPPRTSVLRRGPRTIVDLLRLRLMLGGPVPNRQSERAGQ